MKAPSISFAMAGATLSIAFFIIVNYLTSPQHLWFYYPCLAVLLWPITVFGIKKGSHQQLACFYSAVLIAFLIIENYLETPEYPWFLYGVFPILWWPILASLGEKSKYLLTALIGSTSIILYYILLNVLLAPGYPWFIYPAFAVLWWPLSIYHGKRKSFTAFSFHGTILFTVFFIAVNAVSTPNEIWAVYPIFCVLWWPLSMYFFAPKKRI